MSVHPDAPAGGGPAAAARPEPTFPHFRRIARSALALLAALALLPRGVGAQEQGPSTEGALFLLLPVSAKAVGLGRAMTAMGGPESTFWNPAGLAGVDGGRFLVYRGDHPVAGAATAVSLLLTNRLGAVGTSYQLIDIGGQDVTDNEGNVIGTLTGRNHLAILSLASSFRSVLSLGANVKLVRFQFTCRGQCNDAGVSASSIAIDAGLQVTEPGGIPLTVGALLVHAGSDFGTDQQADPLPTRMRAAAAYEVLGHFMTTEELSLTLTAEVEDRWKNPGSPATYLGAEFTAGRLDPTAGRRDALHVRAGYVFSAEQQLDGASVGVGLQYQRFDMALAKSLASSPFPGESEPIHISFGFIF
jgi:hypothetical protein